MRVSPRGLVSPGRPAWNDSQLGVLPIAAAVSVVSGAQNIISNLDSVFGDTHKYGQPNYTGAEKSRADSYLLGIGGGSVLAGQYLIAQNKTDTSPFAQDYTSKALAQAQATFPSVMQQAYAEGGIPDQADGSGGLRVLLQLGIPFNEQYTGYSTDTGQGPSGTTLDLVNKVRSLPQLPAGSSSSPANMGTGILTGGAGSGLAVAAIALAAGVAVVRSARPRRGRRRG